MLRREPKFVRQSSKDFPIQLSPELLSIIYTRSVVDPSKLLFERLLMGEIGADADLYALNSGVLFARKQTPKKSSESLIKEFVKFVSHFLSLKQRDLLCQNLVIVEFAQLKDKAFRGASTSLAKIFLRAEIMYHASAELREKILMLDSMQDGFFVSAGKSLTAEKAAQLKDEYQRAAAELMTFVAEDGLPETLKRQIKRCIIPGMQTYIVPRIVELSEKSGEKVNLKLTIANFVAFSCFAQNANINNCDLICNQIEEFDETKELALSDKIPREAIEDRMLLIKYLQGQKECMVSFFAVKRVKNDEKPNAHSSEVEMQVSHGNLLRPTCLQSGS